ncbi:hypothetical protein LZZ85_14655 [Terrimonas sp. NA20]|uniref:Uncharacterized protein n=1 Tax=Terrimonas ginsenosidimutans TaxID=2908004 RepID=A0ABS9KTC0_9BACT|nr:hypothetical protein [Terrimonas ginsenosidimutans]MCG2615538.1 hypothetical protein [Terrimonas ginsenosidimutans]
MLEKYQTLRTIYELVRNDDQPILSNISPREIILRQHSGWDVIVTHLYELKQEGLLEILQLNIAQIYLTGKGLEHAMAMTANAAA